MSGWDVAALTMLVVVGGLYASGSVDLARRGAMPPRFEATSFAIGWCAMAAAILPPLDAAAVQLFSAHMSQHELMMLVGAPLLTAGRPLPKVLGGLPPGARVLAAHVLQSAPAAGAWRALTMPVVAWVLHGLAVWVWHVPALYQLAVRNEGVHALQHAMFVGTAVLFWWGVLYGRYGRAGYGAAAFFVFLTVVHSGMLGAAVALAPSPLYPDYAASSHAHGVDPLADQQLAGLIMWIPAGLILTVLGIGLFAAWLGEAGRRERQQPSRTSR
jgi:putative membrane protein